MLHTKVTFGAYVFMEPVFSPRGLFQPEGSFKFSIDALLLAAFSSQRGEALTAIDLGAGCGVVGLALLARNSHLHLLAVEMQEELAKATILNAQKLKVENRINVLCSKVETLFSGLQDTPNSSSYISLLEQKEKTEKVKKKLLREIAPVEIPIVAGSFDLVVANPPYRIKNQGREPVSDARQQALFGDAQTLFFFCRVASQGLKPKGKFCLSFSAGRLAEVFSCCEANNLGIRRLMCVHSKKNKKSDIILVEARKQTATDIAIEPPLILYEGSCLSKQALDFCPELA